MPIVNGKYESPIWENNHQPAMDAAEMQAITDSVEESIHALGDYTTPAQKMGLTGDLSVGASLGVLADIGNVHVWRKTVVAEEEVPAGYKLVDDNTDRTLNDVPNALINLGNTNQRTAYINCADSITVDDGGGISLNSATTHYQANDALNAASWLRGKYIKLYYINDFGNWFGPPALDQNKTYYVPNDAQISVNSATIIVDKLQRVDAYPLTPPGTHITYLTSTNRNAYQEGDNEVPAKYELGPIIEESYKVVGLSSGQNQESYRYGDTPQVSIDGVILPDSLKNGITLYCTAESANTANSTLRGKFLIRPGSFSNANFPVNKVVFIPLDALFTYNEGGDYYLYLDKYQEVIGVPGVPANTSIEYLGVLGEKSKIQVLSYVGTGTSGEANACSVTASFPIEVLFSLGATGIIFSDPDAPGILNGDWGTNANGVMFGKYLTTTFAEHMGFNEGTGTSLGKKSADGKTFYWYNKTFSVTNVSGRLYYFLALG
mgnify:FL=1